MTEGDRALTELLESLRACEKVQALRYRGIAARAEAAGDPVLAQRFHDLHADEQHHLSRLTARLLEMGERPRDLSNVRPPSEALERWEEVLLEQEAAEIGRYTSALATELDPETRALFDEIVEVERRHAGERGGKWTMA